MESMGKKIRLLVVEDSESDFELVLRELRRGGYEPQPNRVENAADLQAALQEVWDLIISDYSLPTLNAPAALKVVKAAWPDVPFIVVSGSIGEDRAVDVLKAGAHDFVTKENLSRLVPAIERELRDVAERQARRSAEKSLRQIEEQLRQAQRLEAIGQLAAGIAHDFNNLLTVINGRSSLILSKLRQADPIREEVAQILHTGERAAALTRQLLAFGRKQLLEPKVLNANDLIAGLEPMLKRLIQENIEIESRLAPDLPPVCIDPNQLEQVLINLVVNARDAMEGGGKLTIETAGVDLDETYARTHPQAQTGAYVRISVTDSGAGMSEDTKARLFEPFFTTKGMGKGTGLGLATVYGIVKQSGGNIEVYSERGTGTTFKIYLPVVQGTPEARSSRHNLAAVKGGHEFILVVEDEPILAQLMQDILETYDYQVKLATRPSEALAYVKASAQPIDLLITDVVMPEMNGPALMAKIHEIRPTLKVLFMSGYTDLALVRNGSIGASTPFIQKPFTPDSVARKVRETLDGSLQ